MIELLGNILIRSVLDLLERQSNILHSTQETTMTEWNFAHHYAVCLSKYFPMFDCDNDVTKNNYNNKRPDIILHSRNTDINNFLVIEIKLKPIIDVYDEKKIKHYWFKAPLKYRYGACLSVEEEQCNVKVFENSTRNSEYEKKEIINSANCTNPPVSIDDEFIRHTLMTFSSSDSKKMSNA